MGKMRLQKLADTGVEKRARTGAKNLENGSPRLRLKAQTCRDATARLAMQDAVSHITITRAIKDAPPLL
jgi:hypothetical protein